jgi:hypothetical protein
VGLGDVGLHRPAPIREFPAEHTGGARAAQNDTRVGQQLEQWLSADQKTSLGGPATQAWKRLEQPLLLEARTGPRPIGVAQQPRHVFQKGRITTAEGEHRPGTERRQRCADRDARRHSPEAGLVGAGPGSPTRCCVGSRLRREVDYAPEPVLYFPDWRQTVTNRAWMILMYGDDRTYGGNKGYDDGIDRYSYDNRVANSKQLAEGDLVVIAGRDKRRGLPRIAGLARVMTVDVLKSTKEVARCPVCRKPRFKTRGTLTPLYRCDNGHEFDEPRVEIVNVNRKIARFGDTYRNAQGAMTVAQLQDAQEHKRDGSSIRALNFEKLQRHLSWDRELHTVAQPQGYPDPDAAARVDEAAKPLALHIAKQRFPTLRVEAQTHSNPGFDLAVFNGQELVRYIEVKSTTRGDPVFYMSDYQREFSRLYSASYSLLVLASLDLVANTCSPQWFDGWIGDRVEMRPVQWRGSLSVNGRDN